MTAAGENLMLRIAFLAGALAVAGTPALAQSQTDMQKLDDEWAAAFNKGDARAVAALYAPDAVVLPDRAATARGRPAIQALVKKLTGTFQNDLKINFVDVKPLGPDFAREITSYSITLKTQPPQQDTGKSVAVLRKAGDKWLIVTHLWNSNK